jgi:hypothetical protein
LPGMVSPYDSAKAKTWHTCFRKFGRPSVSSHRSCKPARRALLDD